jgi:hypothetical protein
MGFVFNWLDLVVRHKIEAVRYTGEVRTDVVHDIGSQKFVANLATWVEHFCLKGISSIQKLLKPQSWQNKLPG